MFDAPFAGDRLVVLENLNIFSILDHDVGNSVKMPGINYPPAGNLDLHCLSTGTAELIRSVRRFRINKSEIEYNIKN